MADYLNALASNLSINGTRSSVTNKTSVDGQAVAAEGTVKADLSTVRSDGKPAATASETSDSTESQEVKQLR